jgi:tRNA G18 (ribose-2'-O)-methylase SpoU
LRLFDGWTQSGEISATLFFIDQKRFSANHASGNFMAEVTAAEVAVAAAWTRWQRYRELHGDHKALDVAGAEAQFELVATGIALSQREIQEVFDDDAKTFVALLTPLPAVKHDERYHFTLVAAAVLLDQQLQTISTPEKQATQFLTGALTTAVLLPVLQRQRHATLHHAALGMLRTLLQLAVQHEEGEMTVKELFRQVQGLLQGDGDGGDDGEDVAIRHGSLCSLLELLLQQKVAGLAAAAMDTCEQATKSWRRYPQFLRAVVLHVVPAVLEDTSAGLATYQALLEMVVKSWEPLQTATGAGAFPHELLYLVCIVMPKAPRELIVDVRLQQLVCFALRHDDPLLRKQGLHILKVAFSHVALLEQPRHSEAKRKTQGSTWMDTWQSFLTASEVIQMHHEQHLIEQVWPQVAELLTSHLVVHVESKQQRDSERWPVLLTFDWMQSLLVRLFAHDNPVVKRLFLSNFMETCVQGWQGWEKQRLTSQAVDVGASFASSVAFQGFVLGPLLRACNDPVLYKHAHRARFQALVADFLASFLAFQFAESEQESVLDDFVAAMEDAIFGEGADSHSPEALLSMLQVFQSSHLKRAASSAATTMLLSAEAVDRLRFLLDVHAMQSFSQAMRTKMLRALSHALTGGFVSASSLPLSTLARVLCVFPTSSLVSDDGEALLHFLTWTKASSVENSSSFAAALAAALEAYLQQGSVEAVLSPVQLARLLLFTAENTSEPEALPVRVSLRAPLCELLAKTPVDGLDTSRLVLLVAKIEGQVQELVGSCSSRRFVFSFQRETFYDGQVSCSYLFDSALAVVRSWVDSVNAAHDVDADHEKEKTLELVTSAVFVLSQMSVHSMNATGELLELDALDALCDELTSVLGTSDHTVFNLALAAKCLSIVGANAAAVDSLRAFDSGRLLPLLLALDTSRRYSGKLDARCAIGLAASKWVLLHQVVEASSFIDTKLLQAVYCACVEALPTAGMDPSALIRMVNVLSLTLSQLAAALASGSNGVEQLGRLLDEVWAAYNDSKAKPDALTRAVVVCMFQPVFLLRAELNATMKHWIAEFIRLGSRHRPNVIFHVACRLCQTWRAHPSSALAFADEVVALLLYKEPLIDEKEQLTMDSGAPFQGFQGFSPGSTSENQHTAVAINAKDRFVRLVVLSFLDDVAVGSGETQQLMDVLLARLLALNVRPDWQKQHMLNSDGFGMKLRSWQALCIVSAHATKPQLTGLLPTLQTALAVPQLPSVRYYMELFGMRIATKFPHEICSGVLLPMLQDANLMPQVGASLLLVSAYLASCKLDDEGLDVDCGELLETMLPWLNTSHGYTRVLAQFLLAKVLPRHVHQLQQSASDAPGLRFLEGTARYLSSNKECKRMLRRQARQLEDFHPDYESSLLGMLSSGFVSEFGELLPRDEALRFSEQLKTAMNELYAQYQLENFVPTPSSSAAASSNAAAASGALTVQRKIDTTALLLEDAALPAAMRADFDAARRGDTLNARQRPRQPLIMCASLVDKTPNLAGLARTCEIFNAQKLVVPNIRLAQQDATFATVSATAHKWMPLEEVRPQGDDLRQALLRWKSEGYTIVAVEQTASSVSLADYTLPRKMVLVLGREKEGIPVDVLQLVDVCVEIPQFGLVRSLNVHVSGALMLWEYTQQQLLSGALESTL